MYTKSIGVERPTTINVRAPGYSIRRASKPGADLKGAVSVFFI